ncbi:class II glutamine amidotransferase [Brucellaceae bacterium C25G]
MCRFLAYYGEPVFLNKVVSDPIHSLVQQSLHASEAKTVTNGDGFGIGWYGAHEKPGVYRDIRPAWSDENLLNLCEQIQSQVFFAHVRASTGTAISRANCHPFHHDNRLFMHNGQIGGYKKLKRKIEAFLPDAFYEHRLGTSDSEVFFLLTLANSLILSSGDPIIQSLGQIRQLMNEAEVSAPLRFTACYTDGKSLRAYRWASDKKPPSLYYREENHGVLIVSEPIDEHARGWNAVPESHTLTVDDKGFRLERFEVA